MVATVRKTQITDYFVNPRKWKVMLVVIVLATFVAYLSSGFSVGRWILSNPNINRNFQGIFEYFFFHPQDLFEPKFTNEIDITKKGKVELGFRNAYVGNYIVGLWFNEDQWSYDPKKFKEIMPTLKMKLSIYSNGKMIRSEDVCGVLSPFFMGYFGGTGFKVFSYKCPEDVPINTSLLYVVEVCKPDKCLANKWGLPKAYISRISSE